MVKYPRNLNVPKEEVLKLREKRKIDRKARKVIRPINKKLKSVTDNNSEGLKFRLKEKEREYKNNKFSLHVTHNKTHDTYLVKIKEPNNKYLDWLWNRLQFKIIDISIALRIFPNVKEQTEAVAALYAVENIINLKESTVIVVADGSTPRCGGLLAHYAKEVISIDPQMKTEYVNNKLMENISCYSSTIEDWLDERKELRINNPVVVVAVHAHVMFQNYLENLIHIINDELPILIISVSCCQDLNITPEEKEKFLLKTLPEYDDWSMHSPCRTVRRWTRNI